MTDPRDKHDDHIDKARPLGGDISDVTDSDTSSELNLRPRTTATTTKRRRRLGAPLLLSVLLLAGGFVVFQFLTSATVFFCEADKVDKTKNCETGRRFRLLGTVDNGSVKEGNPLKFTVSWLGTTIPVTYQGDPGGIFCQGMNVAVEGRYTGQVFEGDRILVKHNETYVEENPDRESSC
jgi:cytochrome c-type biogenesis protein CcmE